MLVQPLECVVWQPGVVLARFGLVVEPGKRKHVRLGLPGLFLATGAGRVALILLFKRCLHVQDGRIDGGKLVFPLVPLQKFNGPVRQPKSGRLHHCSVSW